VDVHVYLLAGQVPAPTPGWGSLKRSRGRVDRRRRPFDLGLRGSERLARTTQGDGTMKYMLIMRATDEAFAGMGGPGFKTEIRRVATIDEFPQDNEWIQKERAWREATGQL
jgi:hypothetical protein